MKDHAYRAEFKKDGNVIIGSEAALDYYGEDSLISAAFKLCVRYISNKR